MASRRDEIRMTPEELERFLADERMLILATPGRDGWPHVTPLWYVMRDSEPWIFTYAKSQKLRNLERDPRATLLVEAGSRDEDVRGVMLTARAEIHRNANTVATVAEEILERYAGRTDEAPGLTDQSRGAVRAQVRKRVAVRFEVVDTVSWDHAKLGGGY